MTKEIEKLIIYDDSKFNPTPHRRKLGLDKSPPNDISDEQKLSLANILYRTGNLTNEDIKKLGMKKVPARKL